ncbi:MAG TPA: AMP-binding protein, partial [Mycobacterium sp.]|nr:AMP-binding protein [Mycobacterium sp.]
MDIIRKTPDDFRVPPNFRDYERTRAGFHWSDVPPLCEGMGPGGCNIAFAAVDRHADGPAATRTALRFIPEPGPDGALASQDLSYAELARSARRFTNVLRSLGIDKGDKVFTIMGRRPELYITILGALRNGSIVSPLFSAFGPEPIATRVTIGEATVLVTTAAIYHRKIVKIRDQLTSVRHIFLVDDDKADDGERGT